MKVTKGIRIYFYKSILTWNRFDPWPLLSEQCQRIPNYVTVWISNSEYGSNIAFNPFISSIQEVNFTFNVLCIRKTLSSIEIKYYINSTLFYFRITRNYIWPFRINTWNEDNNVDVTLLCNIWENIFDCTQFILSFFLHVPSLEALVNVFSLHQKIVKRWWCRCILTL